MCLCGNAAGTKAANTEVAGVEHMITTKEQARKSGRMVGKRCLLLRIPNVQFGEMSSPSRGLLPSTLLVCGGGSTKSSPAAVSAKRLSVSDTSTPSPPWIDTVAVEKASPTGILVVVAEIAPSATDGLSPYPSES